MNDLEKYIGVKILKAKPMTRGEYNLYRGWTIPENENPEDKGSLVVYPDGYESWSPKKQFDEAYRPTNGMTFGLALEALKNGFAVERSGWNGKNMHVTASRLYTPDNIQVNNLCLLLFNVDRKYNTWVPSITDILAEDWSITK